jgi:hypothetical protein
MKGDILQETEEQPCRASGGLQNGTHRGRGAAADQSTQGRMGSGKACKAEKLRMKNISIESSGGEKKG